MIPGSGRSPEGGHGNHSRVLAWRIPWTEEPGSYSPLGHKELDTTERMHAHTLTHKHTHTRHYKFVQTHRMLNIKSEPRDFPSGPVQKTPCFHCRGYRFNLWPGTKIMHSKWHGRKMFFEKESEHNGERGTWSDGDVLMWVRPLYQTSCSGE